MSLGFRGAKMQAGSPHGTGTPLSGAARGFRGDGHTGAVMQPRVESSPDAIVFRYPRQLSRILWPLLLITAIAVVAAAASGWQAIITVPLLACVLVVEVAVLRARDWIDEQGVHLRMYRTRTIRQSQITELFIRHRTSGELHAETLAVTHRDGRITALDTTTARCPASGSPRLEQNLRDAQQRLRLPPATVRRPGTRRSRWDLLLRRDIRQ